MLQSQGGTPLLLTPPCNAKLSILPKPSKPLPKLPVLSHVMLELTSLSQPSTFLPSPPLCHSACGSISPLHAFCRGSCRACLANEKLLWISLWAFQEGLARFLQSRHSKTVCFSKYIRDFSGTWLWQGLSAVVSQVVSLLGVQAGRCCQALIQGCSGSASLGCCSKQE